MRQLPHGIFFMFSSSTPSKGGLSRPLLLDMTAYQWTVLFAAWLGWGFDIFDGLLFNYVAPNCVPTLLHIPLGTPEAKTVTLHWVGILTSLLLVGWAVGGILFGRVADRLGRTRTLLLTMLLYSVGTAACAVAPSMLCLVLFRIVASLGIGGEWAAGAAMVAEVVPEKRRVEAGALLYTSAPFGLFLATFLTYQIAGVTFKGAPEISWRYVFLCGLLPALAAFIVRLFVREPERWQSATSHAASPRLSELFDAQHLRLTLSGFSMALTVLLVWWSSNAFIPTIATGLAGAQATTESLSKVATTALGEEFKRAATNWFNLGGLIGTLLTIPAAKYLGRRPMFAIYLLLSALAMLTAFGHQWTPQQQLLLYFPIGLTVFGVFGAFTFYLPELYPTRLRATGAGFCYNTGRLIAAIGPFLVGSVSARGTNALPLALHALFVVGFIPILGMFCLPFVIETRGRVLAD